MAAQPAGWHRKEIIAAVGMKGSSLAAIGREVGLKRQSMSWALISPHVKANRAIAEFLGVPLHDLWPQWFDADGKLISTAALPRPAAKCSPRKSRFSIPRKYAA